MRTLLLRSLFSPLATLPAPPPADAALEELGRALGQGARRLFGRSLAIREVDAGSATAANSRSTHSTIPSTTSSASASASLPRPVTPTCCS